MTDLIINNPKNLRICILYEFTKGKKPFKTYKKLMKRLGDDFMEYPEFEFWFMRFAQGKYDLDYDRSLEPKKRQITNLPVDVFEKVGDYLHFEDRNHLRNVSKDIQLLVDDWNPKITEFTFCSFDWWTIVQNSKSYEYYREAYANCPATPKHQPIVLRILKNPKLRLNKLNVLSVCRDAKWMKIEEEFRESSTKLHVNNLTLEYPKSPIDLSLFAVKSLEEVTIIINETSVKKMNEIVNSEQCKGLKMLTIKTDLSPLEFPFESFIGYPRFTIYFLRTRAELKVVEFIKTLVKCSQLELCKLEFYYFYTPNWELFKENFSEKDTMVPDSPNIRRYPIQGSTDFYEINIRKNSVSIERKS